MGLVSSTAGSRLPATRATRARFLATLIAGALAVSIAAAAAHAQPFVKVVDPTNPILTDSPPPVGSYAGTSWIDLNGDGRDDLFISQRRPYRNDGGGVFTKLTGQVIGQGQAIGHSFADIDNDGDADVFVCGNIIKGSFLYRNNGDETFTKIDTGDIADFLGNTAWSCAWADYNNDSFVDLVLAAANGFAGINHPNRLFLNNGDGSFTRIDSTVITTGLDAYTIPNWTDLDDDGDMDLTIGAGEISSLSPDYIYRNMLTETGAATFVIDSTSAIGTDLHNGQIFNWVDYDNDGDLDAFLTNYSSGPSAITNDLYRNDSGTLVRLTSAEAGDILIPKRTSLASVWGDYDNDGDQDCLVTTDGASTNEYYTNNGDGTFTAVTTGDLVTDAGPHYGAAAADYDLDGDLDLMLTGPSSSTRALFRNDLADGNTWIQITLVGTISNRSALGARLTAVATIDSARVQQMQEISSQNSFGGASSLTAHFGLGDATAVDSLTVRWPLGLVEVFTGLAANDRYVIVEGEGETQVGIDRPGGRIASLELAQNQPNPFRPFTEIAYRVPSAGNVSLKVYDAAGREVATLLDERQGAGLHTARFEPGPQLASGIYFYRLASGTQLLTRKMLFLR